MATRSSESIERAEPAIGRSNTLALLYQGVFTGIVRLQAGRQALADPSVFRRRITEALEDVQKEATGAGYSSREVRDAEFAIVAFLDEAILTLKDPARERWAINPLSVQLYKISNAGDVFFERLEELRSQTDSQHLADILEVYLLCLLLGFEGRYSGLEQAKSIQIADRLRSRIEGIRGDGYRLSPPLHFAEATVMPAERNDKAWLLWIAAGLFFPVLLFWFYHSNLDKGVGHVVEALQQTQGASSGR